MMPGGGRLKMLSSPRKRRSAMATSASSAGGLARVSGGGDGRASMMIARLAAVCSSSEPFRPSSAVFRQSNSCLRLRSCLADVMAAPAVVEPVAAGTSGTIASASDGGCIDAALSLCELIVSGWLVSLLVDWWWDGAITKRLVQK